MRFGDIDRRDALKMQGFLRENTINKNLYLLLRNNAAYTTILPCGSEAVGDHACYDERNPSEANQGGQAVSQK